MTSYVIVVTIGVSLQIVMRDFYRHSKIDIVRIEWPLCLMKIDLKKDYMKKPFKMTARVLAHLGEDLIKDESIALLELVKTLMMQGRQNVL